MLGARKACPPRAHNHVLPLTPSQMKEHDRAKGRNIIMFEGSSLPEEFHRVFTQKQILQKLDGKH